MADEESFLDGWTRVIEAQRLNLKRPPDPLDMLKQIARGRPDNGRPFGGEKARQLAREALVAADIDWTEQPDCQSEARRKRMEGGDG